MCTYLHPNTTHTHYMCTSIPIQHTHYMCTSIPTQHTLHVYFHPKAGDLLRWGSPRFEPHTYSNGVNCDCCISLLSSGCPGDCCCLESEGQRLTTCCTDREQTVNKTDIKQHHQWNNEQYLNKTNIIKKL